MSRRRSWSANVVPRLLVVLLPIALLSPRVAAQVPGLTAPEVSPAATVSQVVGLTTLEVSYHRPAANGRAVWGALVPFGQVWRAGANENTTFTVSTPVTVNGTTLGAGTYGLHMIPTATTWTVIFSREAGAWGSFSYDEKEDVARVTVKPEAAPQQERLGYSFDEPTADAVTLAMRWEKLRVPIPIKIDLGRTVLDTYKAQLRGLPRFGWQGWNQAANWAAENGIDLADALVWVDRSVNMNRNFTNLRTKSLVLAKKGDQAAAATILQEAMSMATDGDQRLRLSAPRAAESGRGPGHVREERPRSSRFLECAGQSRRGVRGQG